MSIRITRRTCLMALAGLPFGCSPVPDQNVVPKKLNTDAIDNRILFTGSPWPNGHAIEKFRWWAILDPDHGLWFHLHLVSAEYGKANATANGVDGENWASKDVWTNFGNCILSSSEWDHAGIFAGDSETPLDITTLDGAVLEVDSLPRKTSDRNSFGIYLHGGDQVAGHEISLKRASQNRWDIDWTGGIALTNLGVRRAAARFDARGDQIPEREKLINTVGYDHRFVARKLGVKFEGIELPNTMSKEEAMQLVTPCVANIAEFQFHGEGENSWFRFAPTAQPKKTNGAGSA